MRISLFILAFSFVVGATLVARAAWAQEAEPAKACLSTQEMRETVPDKRLKDPAVVLKRFSNEHKAEALGAKLCRQGAQYIYEVTLLPPDGRVLHILVDAGTGQILPGKFTK